MMLQDLIAFFWGVCSYIQGLLKKPCGQGMIESIICQGSYLYSASNIYSQKLPAAIPLSLEEYFQLYVE